MQQPLSVSVPRSLLSSILARARTTLPSDLSPVRMKTVDSFTVIRGTSLPKTNKTEEVCASLDQLYLQRSKEVQCFESAMSFDKGSSGPWSSRIYDVFLMGRSFLLSCTSFSLLEIVGVSPLQAKQLHFALHNNIVFAKQSRVAGCLFQVRLFRFEEDKQGGGYRLFFPIMHPPEGLAGKGIVENSSSQEEDYKRFQEKLGISRSQINVTNYCYQKGRWYKKP